MADNVLRWFGAVAREVRTIEHDGKPASVVVATRRYRTTRDDLWDALTQADRIARWFMPITGELSLGGRYQLQGNAGGTVLRCDKPDTIGVTWEFGGGITWVNVRLREVEDGVELELHHIAHPEAHWDTYGPGAVGVGWELGLLGLALHFDNPHARPPESDPAWAASEEAKRLMSLCAVAWGDAAAAAGTDPIAAAAAAERTRKFYCGEG